MIDTRALIRPLADELRRLLSGLDDDQWEAPTSAGTWRVRDVVAHLIDGDLRRVSAQRDGHDAPDAPPIRSYADLLRYLDELNAAWVSAARRLSHAVLLDLITLSSARAADVLEAAALDGPALFPVAWADDADSTMWLDIGREYTERWHHQDQIREAVGAAALADAVWLRPVIEISMLAVSARYADVDAPEGTSVQLVMSGNGGGEWMIRKAGEWTIVRGRDEGASVLVEAGALEFARMLLHRLAPAEVARVVQVSGEADLAKPLIETRAVMV